MIKNPVSVKGARTILQGIEIMRSNNVDSLLVIDKENVLKGIVTFKDIKITNEKSRVLSEIMSENPLRVNEDDSLVDILTVMNENSVGFIPVVNSEEKW